MSDTKTSENWLVKHAEAEAKKDVIPFSERAGNIIGIVGVLLVVLFFAVHQMESTGFFTSSFSTAEMLLVYLSLVAGMITTAIGALFGRKNLARLFDVFGVCFFTVTLTWLYIVFPFSFTHFADVLPDFLQVSATMDFQRHSPNIDDNWNSYCSSDGHLQFSNIYACSLRNL